VTEQFVDSLPEGLDNVEWQIASPKDGVKTRLEALILGDGLSIDLEVYLNTKDEDDNVISYRALIRMVPDLQIGAIRKNSAENVYVFSNARAYFLDRDGHYTDSMVKLKVVISTDHVAPGLSAGHVVMWPPDTEDYRIASAS
jgi:hypothetical protein